MVFIGCPTLAKTCIFEYTQQVTVSQFLIQFIFWEKIELVPIIRLKIKYTVTRMTYV